MAKKTITQEPRFKEGSPFSYMNDKKPAWQRVSISGVKLFLDHIYGMKRINRGKSTDAEQILYEEAARKYLSEKRDYYKDLTSWRTQSTMAPKSLRTYLSAVREFFDVHGIILADKEKLRKMKKNFKGGDEAPLDAPTHGMIRSFIEHGDIRLKAITLLGSASGMRIGEILTITEKSIDWDRRMITLKAADTKTQSGRVVFFTRESEKALTAYLKGKTKYIEENNKIASRVKASHPAIDDGRIFPFSEVSINRSWNRTLRRAGQAEKNQWGYSIFHLHSLRQFFSSQLRKNGCPDSVVEVMLGHKPYLSTYIRYTPAELQEAYEKYSPVLIVGSTDDVNRKVQMLQDKSLEVNGRVQQLEKEKEALEARLRQVEQMQVVEAKIEETDLYKKIMADVEAKFKK